MQDQQNSSLSPDLTAQQAASSPALPNLGQEESSSADQKTKRTLGLKLFDIGVYPILSNFAVFAVSVVATFLTARGGDKKASGELVYGKAGKWFQRRGEWMEAQFQNKFNMTPENAEMGKIVAFSFIDGSLFAPFVKLLEDRREKISLWIDEKLGTKAPDPAVYNAEPKQTWGSVLGGRFVTAGIVIPTAIALSRKDFTQNSVNGKTSTKFTFGNKGNKSLNDILFNDPSERHLGTFERVQNAVNGFIKKLTGVKPSETISVPGIGKAKQGKTAFKTLTRMTYFEFFYTSLCTAGLYIGSRMFARRLNEQNPGASAGKTHDANTDSSASLKTAAHPENRLREAPLASEKQAHAKDSILPTKRVAAETIQHAERVASQSEQQVST